jgi:hypothetical protein
MYLAPSLNSTVSIGFASGRPSTLVGKVPSAGTAATVVAGVGTEVVAEGLCVSVQLDNMTIRVKTAVSFAFRIKETPSMYCGY